MEKSRTWKVVYKLSCFVMTELFDSKEEADSFAKLCDGYVEEM